MIKEKKVVRGTVQYLTSSRNVLKDKRIIESNVFEVEGSILNVIWSNRLYGKEKMFNLRVGNFRDNFVDSG